MKKIIGHLFCAVVLFLLTGKELSAQVLPQVNNGHRKSIACSAFWGDNKWYATAGSDIVIKVWDFKTNRVLKNLESHEYSVSAMAAFEIDGVKQLVSGGIYELKIWDVAKGIVIKEIPIQGSVKCIKMSNSGDGFYFSLDKQIKKYVFSKGYAEYVVSTEADIVSFDFDANEQIFYIASERKVEKVDLKNLTERTFLSRNTYGKIVEVDLSSSGKWLAAAGFYDVAVWNVSVGPVAEAWVCDSANATACFDNTSDILYARKNQYSNIVAIDVKNREIIKTSVAPKFLNTMSITCTNLDGLIFSYGFSDFLFWEAKSLRPLREVKNILPAIEDMAQHQNSLIFGVGSKGKLGVFDFQSGSFEKFNSRQYERVNGVESINQDEFISVSYDGTIAINSTQAQGKIRSVNFENPSDTTVRKKVDYDDEERTMFTLKMLTRKNIEEYAYIPQSNMLAYTTGVNLEMIDLQKRELLVPLTEHKDYIRNITLSHSGKYLLTASLDKTVKLWDIESRKVLLTYFGHTNRVFDAVFSKDDKYVITGCADGTVRVFDAMSGELIRNAAFNQGEVLDLELNPKGDLLAIAGGSGLEVWDWQNSKLVYDLSNSAIEVRQTIFLNDDLIVAKNKNDWIQFYSLKNGLVGQLIVTDYENLGFVFFTPDGYYMGDKKSVAENMHFIFKDEVYLFEQFDLFYNRPDVILERLGVADSNYINVLKKAHRKRIEKIGLKVAVFDSPPVMDVPSVRLLNGAYYDIVSSSSYILPYEVASKNNYIDQVGYIVNGVPSSVKNVLKVKSLSVKDKFDISLSQGLNIIEVYAINGKGVQSLKARVEVEYKPAKLVKPDLYLITIGAAEYEQKEMNLRYAAKDGKDLKALFADGNSAFQNVNTLTLSNENVTRSIFSEMNRFLKKAKVDDELMIMVSGHGLFDEDYDYFLATYDTDFSIPSDKAIPYAMFEEFLGKTIVRNKVLFLDACHSGEIDKEEVELAELANVEEGEVTFRSFGNKTIKNKESELGLQNSFEIQKDLFNDLRDNNGTNVISAAGGTEFAMEGADWNNGVFTYAFLYGIKSKEADLDGNGRIILSELQTYLQDKVVELTSGRQTPTSRSFNLQNDFTVWEY